MLPNDWTKGLIWHFRNQVRYRHLWLVPHLQAFSGKAFRCFKSFGRPDFQSQMGVALTFIAVLVIFRTFSFQSHKGVSLTFRGFKSFGRSAVHDLSAKAVGSYILSRYRLGAFSQVFRSPFEKDLPSILATFGSQIYYPVGLSDNVKIVLYYYDSVSRVD